ncbi:MAG: glycosyltransferase family 2 protein [Calditrichota bacterium]
MPNNSIPDRPKSPAGTVIIVNYRSRAGAERCLASLQSLINSGWLKVIVVDNDSGEGEADLIAGSFPEIEVINAGINLGFGGGNNLGLKRAVGDWVCFLNPDTQVEPGTLEVLAEYLSRNPLTGCVAPAIANEQGKIIKSYYPFTNFFTSLLSACGLHPPIPLNHVNNRWRLTYSLESAPAIIDRSLGAALMIPRRALEVVGGFDERFFLYSEEEDLCRRLHHAGWKVVYYPQAKVIHQGGESARQQKPLTIAAANWSRYLYLHKHCGRLSAELSRWIWIAALSIRLSVVFLLPSGSRRDYLKGYAWSIRALFDRGWFDHTLRPDAKYRSGDGNLQA